MREKINQGAGIYIMPVFIAAVFFQCTKDAGLEPTLSKAQLGKMIFLDKTLSNPVGQSCASCHTSTFSFTDPQHMAVSQGAVNGLFGSRNAPSVSYAMFSPVLHYDDADEAFIGGQFWDGRANSLEAQAMQPFFNSLEMNLTGLNMFESKIKQADFYDAYTRLYGKTVNPKIILGNIADAVAVFERTPEVNSFSSKFDYYLQGKAELTSIENEGMLLFKDTAKGKCANCHIIDPDPDYGKILFTDFTYDNIGVPKNLGNPFYVMPPQFNPGGAAFIDSGLARTTHSLDNFGQFKVPTLRNIAMTAPYFHNGVFSTLEEVVHFYNQRDIDPSIATPEVSANVNHEELGNLKLTPDEEKAIVAFLKTLSDGYK